MDDVLITNGSEVKALPNGKVSGYLVRFSTENDPDITSKRDFFTAKTDFDLARSIKCTLYFDHGLDGTLKKRDLGFGEMKMDDVGVWVEAQMNLRDEYEKAVYDLARKGKLGWSSGTASHLVIRESKSNGTNEIKKWPLGLDASLTPTPAEPRNDAQAMKSVFSLAEYVKTKMPDTGYQIGSRVQVKPGKEHDEETKDAIGTIKQISTPALAVLFDAMPDMLHKWYVESELLLVEGKHTMPPTQTTQIKGLFADCLAENMSPWTMQDALYSALRKIQEAAEGAAAVGQTLDTAAMVESVLTEYFAKLKAWALTFIKQEDDSSPMAYMSATKSLAAAGQSLASLKSKLENDLPIEQHSDAVESAVVEFAKSAQTITQMVESLGERWEARTSSRIKAGRQLSASNKAKMDKACGKLKACGEMVTAVHDELMKIGVVEPGGLEMKTTPPDFDVALQLEAQFLEFQTKSLLATAGV